MEGVCKELNDFKAEMEKIKAECQIKTQLSESLKKAYNEQLLKFEEAKQKIEKHTKDLNVKSEEIAEARQYSEKIESCLNEKELFLRNLSSANENLKADFGQKLQNLEAKNRELVHALDELTARNKELEQNVCAGNQEIVGIRKLLTVTERKLFEAEQSSQEAKELKQRDDVILKLEDENEKVQDQLKWKKEQFQHLEEAHKGLQDQFQMNKEDWAKEKSALIEEISSLQTNLDSQTRILEGLQTRLEVCNQALVHEESRRKLLEIQVSEFESRFGNFFSHCEEEKSEIETLNTLRNEEMAKLRNTLGIKETLAKEMEFKIVHLEKENQELMESLKELRESQIRNAGVTSLNKLRNKLRGLEQLHSRCSTNLKDKESKWLSQIEKMNGDIRSYKFEMKQNEEQMKKLQMELESCHSIIEVLNQQIPMLVTIFKSELSEAYSITYNANAEMQVSNKEKRDKFSLLAEQLKMKSGNLDNMQLELSQEDKKVEALMKRVESFKLMEQQKVLLEEELQQHKRMLQESAVYQSNLKEQLLQIESKANDKRDVSEALEKTNLELAEKIRQTSQLKHQLQCWESNAGRLKACLEEKQETCRQMENSLLSQADTVQTLEHEKESLICTLTEQERKIEDLQHRIILLELRLAEKTKNMEVTLQKKNNLFQIAKVMDSCIENLQKDITSVKQESMSRESEAAALAWLDAEKAFRLERETLLKSMDEKEHSIKALQLLTLSLEQELTSAVISSFSDVIENQVKIDVLTEALKKSMYLIEVETEKKNKVIFDLEKEVCHSHLKLKQQEESLLYMKHEAEQLQSLLETNRLKTKNLMDGQERMEGTVKQLEFEKGVLLQDIMKLSTEREETLNTFEETCNRISDFSSEDVEMMDTLRKLLQRSDEETTGPAMDLMVHNELHSSTRENSNTLSTTAKKLQATNGERSPLQEVNLQQILINRSIDILS